MYDSYTVIIPTMWQSIGCLSKMVDIYSKSKHVKKIIIIDNDPSKALSFAKNKKIKIVTNNRNLYVNPSWNWGVNLCKTSKIIIANDDIIMEDFEKLILFIDKYLIPGMIIGPHYTCFTNPSNILDITENKEIDINGTNKSKEGWGWGTFMVLNKKSYKIIPAELLIWRGDVIQKNNNIAYDFHGVHIETKMSTTIKSKNLRDKGIEDKNTFLKYYDEKGNLINFNK